MTARRTTSTPAPADYVPDRGDVVWLDFGPPTGHGREARRRPAVVLSPAVYNSRTSLALCCPVTSEVKDYPFEVALQVRGRVRGVVLADQVRSLDWRARHADYLDTLPADVVARILARARALLA